MTGRVRVLVCTECNAKVSVEESKDAEPLYKCYGCDITFSPSSSADGQSNRCPYCKRFASKIREPACPFCGQGELILMDAWSCPYCGELHLSEELVSVCRQKAEQSAAIQAVAERGARKASARRVICWVGVIVVGLVLLLSWGYDVPTKGGHYEFWEGPYADRPATGDYVWVEEKDYSKVPFHVRMGTEYGMISIAGGLLFLWGALKK